MKVILISSEYKKLGVSGDIIHVKSGYARNFLIPRGQVVTATKENLKIFQAKKMELIKISENQYKVAKNRANTLNQYKQGIKIFVKSGEKGKLFGSINQRDIVNAIMDQLDLEINKNEIKLLDGPIRKIGDHQVLFQPHSKVSISFLVHVCSKS